MMCGLGAERLLPEFPLLPVPITVALETDAGLRCAGDGPLGTARSPRPHETCTWKRLQAKKLNPEDKSPVGL